MFSVAEIHKMRVFVSVPEAFGNILQPGLTADVTVPQMPDRHFKAEFLTSANGFDPITRTAITEFTIENEDRALWPGSYGAVTITAPLKGDTLIIPSSALVFQEASTEVAVLDAEDRVHFKPIKVGKLMDGFTEVLSGISTADRLVQTPSAALLEGDRVRVVTPRPGYEDKTIKSSIKSNKETDKTKSAE